MSVLWLSAGTALGQGIVVLVAPILSRLYFPDDYGALAVYVSMMGIFTVVAGGRYELAITIPEEEEEAEGLLKLSLVLVSFTTITVALLVLFFGKTFSTFVKVPSLAPFLWLLPIGVLFSGIYQGLNYLLLRKKQFPLIARTRVLQGGGMSGVQLLLGVLGVRPLGLLLGQIVGQGAGITSLWNAVRRSRAADPHPSVALKPLAKKYQRFPLLSTWGGLFSILSMQLPVIALSALFGPVITGFYSLGWRVLQTPLTLIGHAVGQVFFAEVGQARREGRLAVVVEEGFSRLLPLGCSLLLPLAVTTPEVFSLVFGKTWLTAGIYAQMLIPWLLLVFINSPLSTLTTVLERQDIEMVFQGSLLAVRLGAMLLGRAIGGAYAALGLFAFVSALWWGGYTFWNLSLVNIQRKRIWGLFFKSILPLLPSLLGMIFLKFILSPGKEKEIALLIATAMTIACALFRERKKMLYG